MTENHYPELAGIEDSKVNLPTIPSRFQKYPDPRNDEYHSGGFIWGLVAWVVLVGALIGVGLAVSK
mgnify:CR=1 FL=1